MILGLQIIALIFALIMIYFAYLHYRRGEINGMEMLFWMISWVGAMFIVVFPDVFRTFARTISITRAFDLAVLGGFILIIPIIYLAYIRSKKIEKKLEQLIRETALKDVKDDKKRR